MSNDAVRSHYVTVNGLRIHYLASGDGDPVILLHGWPTSSHLWRKIIPALAESAMVVAPDLPGFGKSDKPWDVLYTHDFHAKVLDGFLQALNLNKVSVILHDIGAPIGLLWAVRNTGKLRKLVVLNSLFYPDGCSKLFYTQNISLFRRALMTVPYPKAPALLKALLLAIHTVGVRKLVFTRWPGIYMVMTKGVKTKKAMARETIRSYQAPFSGAGGRRILEKTFVDLQLDELHEIVENLSTLNIPAHIIYGEDDWVLPRLGEECGRLQKDLPHAHLTAISGCGHFLQEDQPERLCRLLVDFLRD